ncbi:MAG: hypothetical protein J3K34DRAFT_208485 [Monoraphidium minutum]|nr:MAG: hypothetical protein J3K34DRAFT_208485 [Monoraphidium minutum]
MRGPEPPCSAARARTRSRACAGAPGACGPSGPLAPPSLSCIAPPRPAPRRAALNARRRDRNLRRLPLWRMKAPHAPPAARIPRAPGGGCTPRPCFRAPARAGPSLLPPLPPCRRARARARRPPSAAPPCPLPLGAFFTLVGSTRSSARERER